MSMQQHPTIATALAEESFSIIAARGLRGATPRDIRILGILIDDIDGADTITAEEDWMLLLIMWKLQGCHFQGGFASIRQRLRLKEPPLATLEALHERYLDGSLYLKSAMLMLTRLYPELL